MNLEVIERRLLGLDDEIHRILQYIYEQKKYDIASEIKDYENLKKIISEHMKEPIDPTSEIRKMRINYPINCFDRSSYCYKQGSRD